VGERQLGGGGESGEKIHLKWEKRFKKGREHKKNHNAQGEEVKKRNERKKRRVAPRKKGKLRKGVGK